MPFSFVKKCKSPSRCTTSSQFWHLFRIDKSSLAFLQNMSMYTQRSARTYWRLRPWILTFFLPRDFHFKSENQQTKVDLLFHNLLFLFPILKDVLLKKMYIKKTMYIKKRL